MILSSEGYKHVNVINRDTNERVPITSGAMTVTDIYHWDENLHLVSGLIVFYCSICLISEN